jgi:hypothetical protein
VKVLAASFIIALLLSALAVAVLFCTVQASTDVSGIPKPSVPEFTVELVDSSYDVPTTYEINPYTGENVTYEGYHVKSTSIQVKIENQPFTPYLNESYNQTINFYYNIRIKGYYTDTWIELYNPSDGFPHQWSDSQYTVFSYIWGGDANTLMGSKSVSLPAGGKVDFQVEAMIGYVHRSGEPPGFPWTFYGETSGWSNTQTITIGESQTPTPSPATTPTPTAPNMGPTSPPRQEPALTQEQLEIIVGAAIAAAIIGAGLVLLIYLIKRK